MMLPGAANLFMAHEDDLVPSWAEFHHELFQELVAWIINYVTSTSSVLFLGLLVIFYFPTI